MEFCVKCGAILLQAGKRDKCPRCNYSTKASKEKIKTSEKIHEKKEIAVVKEEESNVNPITTELCPRCKNDKAYFWTVQTRASDEAETKFFKCTKCGHTHKVYR